MLDVDTLIWLGIVFCVSQPAMFSGLNLAFFSVSRLGKGASNLLTIDEVKVIEEDELADEVSTVRLPTTTGHSR
ncbi:MAG: hypothetical protein ACJAYE_002868 [Candidatus Azotimanducaceae bacterium]|jgi:hypothetical protein